MNRKFEVRSPKSEASEATGSAREVPRRHCSSHHDLTDHASRVTIYRKCR
jgi:hypothetical protein